jgi:hypothetical protein
VAMNPRHQHALVYGCSSKFMALPSRLAGPWSARRCCARGKPRLSRQRRRDISDFSDFDRAVQGLTGLSAEELLASGGLTPLADPEVALDDRQEAFVGSAIAKIAARPI